MFIKQSIPPVEKNYFHWHLLSTYGKDVSTARQWLIHEMYVRSHIPWSHAHANLWNVYCWWKCIVNIDGCRKILFWYGKLAVSNSIIVLTVTVVVCMKINRRYYFQSISCKKIKIKFRPLFFLISALMTSFTPFH